MVLKLAKTNKFYKQINIRVCWFCKIAVLLFLCHSCILHKIKFLVGVGTLWFTPYTNPFILIVTLYIANIDKMVKIQSKYTHFSEYKM